VGAVPDIPASVSDLLAALEVVPWFANLGRPTPDDAGVQRMAAWEDWPGPEEPTVAEMSLRHQELYDRIMAEAGDHQPELADLWGRIHAAVFRRAAHAVPFDPAQDAWHGPTTAVWVAAWAAGLIGLCLQTGRPVPPELREQWGWYARGHWPSGYASVRGKIGPLLVY
jgi:hypothetical protein